MKNKSSLLSPNVILGAPIPTRNTAVSIAKGLAIIMMVIGHAGAPTPLVRFISIFHMPLFFMLSGYCFKEKYLTDFKNFAKKRFTGIYFPYITFSLLFLFCHQLFVEMHIYDITHPESNGCAHVYPLKEYLNRAIKILFMMQGHDTLLAGFCFLKDLFFGSFYFYLLAKYTRKSFWVPIALAAILILLSYTELRIKILFLEKRIVMAILFIYLGYLAKSLKLKSNFLVILITIEITYLASACGLFKKVGMLDFTTLEALPFVIFALVGSYMLFSISKILSNWDNRFTRFLIYAGNHSLGILAWHFLFLRGFTYVLIQAYHMPIEKMASFPVMYSEHPWYLGYTAFGVFGPLALVWVWQKVKLRYSLLKK